MSPQFLGIPTLYLTPGDSQVHVYGVGFEPSNLILRESRRVHPRD
jgi:hypothetical protein